jgi:hypothetical protein
MDRNLQQPVFAEVQADIPGSRFRKVSLDNQLRRLIIQRSDGHEVLPRKALFERAAVT